MQSPRWRRVESAAKNFARSPLPTLAIWVGDALSGLTLDLWGRAIAWRIRRQASSLMLTKAVIEVALIVFVLTFGAALWVSA